MVLANLAVRLIVELLGVGFAGYWGYNLSADPILRLALGAGAIAVFALIWGRFLAPNASSSLTSAQKDNLGTIVLLISAAGFASAGQPLAALVYAVIVIVNAVILALLGDAVAQWTARSRS